MKKLNLGCGWDMVEGWINIDKRRVYSLHPTIKRMLKMIVKFLSSYRIIESGTIYIPEVKVKDFLRHDITKGLPFKDNEVDFIYAAHIIEHLSPDKANFVLKECHRVLKEGGTLRILVPDLNLLVEDYLKGKQTGDPLIADKFIEAMKLEGTGNPKPFLNRILASFNKGHQWMYDFESLAHRLRKIGFSDIRKVRAMEGETPDLHLFQAEKSHPDSLYLEAKKKIRRAQVVL